MSDHDPYAWERAERLAARDEQDYGDPPEGEPSAAELAEDEEQTERERRDRERS